jgi:hypothetical protein
MLWIEPGLDIFFALLDHQAQWQLHEYYLSDESLDESIFEIRRRDTDQAQPSLRHRAGKHFKLLESPFISASNQFGVDREQMRRAVTRAAATANASRRARPSKRNIFAGCAGVQIAVIANPPDARKVARAFLDLAAYQARQDDTEG